MAPGILDDLHTQVQSTLASKPLKEQLAYKLLDHTAVTDDYYSLAFEAAASHQLQFTSSHSASTGRNDLLISSTYNSSSHLLDLSRVDTQSRLMALALTYMKPVRTDYATASYTESFNWDQVFQVLRRLVTAERHEWKKQDFYVVIFRSKLKENINRDRLGELDDHSHEEATASGGLLKYWFGSTNEERRNLATCWWSHPEDARAGGTGPWHKLARAAAREMYESIVFSTHRLTVEDGVENWRMEDWTKKA